MFWKKRRRRRRSGAAFRWYYFGRPKDRERESLIIRQFKNLSEETKRAVISVFLFSGAAVIFLINIGLAGKAGLYADRFLALLIGVGKWYLPFILFFSGIFFLISSKQEIRAISLLGGVLFFVALNNAIHLFFYSQRLFPAARAGLGGGMIGFILSYPLYRYLGFWVSSILLLAFILVGLFLFFNTSFHHILERLKAAAAFLKMGIFFGKKEKEKEEIGEGEMQEGEEIFFDRKEIPLTEDEAEEEEQKKETLVEEKEKEPSRRKRRYTKMDIPFSLLSSQTTRPMSGNIEKNQEIIRKTLENFNIPVEMGEVNVGPTVTQYTLKPAEGIKLSKIVGLSDNLALALSAHPIRIEAPIPNKSLVGIEVPNRTSALVPLRTLLESSDFKKRKSNLMIALGKDVKGASHFADLQEMPHLLIAGSTGSGKSVCINSIIVSLLYQNSPEDLKFILVDPKRVELPIYNSIPYLLTPVITEVKKTIYALRWAIIEMERRFDILSKFHKRDIISFNKDADEKMPYIVIIIDELADLMSAAGAEIEGLIIRLAQMARAVGIHLVLATQRPSVDILTGLIKANITSRIAFSVASLVDSRTILDMGGAEKLLGRGDMLYISAKLSKPKRLQGSYVSEQDIKNVVEYLAKKAPPEYLDEVIQPTGASGSFLAGGMEKDSDPLLDEAKEVIIQAGRASASLLQRRLKIGYARAARILDLLESEGFVGPAEGAKPREILISQEEHEEHKEAFSEDRELDEELADRV